MDSLSIAASKPGVLQERCPHPWRRFWARVLDGFIYFKMWDVFLILIMRENISQDGPGAFLLRLLAGLICMIVCEPLLLSRLGTTAGKWAMGLSVRHESSRLLTYREAMHRMGKLLWYGNGLTEKRHEHRLYHACDDGQSLAWDEGCAFIIKDYGWRQGVALATVCAVLAGVLLVTQSAAELPRHRGDITAAEFVSNMNDLAGYHEFNQGQALAADGAWRRLPPQGGVAYSMMQIMPDFQLTEEDGVLTAVRFRQEYRGMVNYRDLQDQMYLAALSFVGAQQGVGIWQLLDRDFLQATIYGPPGDFTVERAGITIECRLSGQYFYHSGRTSGYTYAHSMGLLFTDDDDAVTLDFAMSKSAP